MKHAHLACRGVATLPIVFVFGVLTVAIGIGVTALAFSESLTSQSSYQSARALTYAEAGARDALIRIARNKGYACATADCYTLPLESGGCTMNTACARVSVSTGVGSTTDPKVVSSEGRAGLHVRTVQVNVVLDTLGDGKIASTTWMEI